MSMTDAKKIFFFLQPSNYQEYLDLPHRCITFTINVEEKFSLTYEEKNLNTLFSHVGNFPKLSLELLIHFK